MCSRESLSAAHRNRVFGTFSYQHGAEGRGEQTYCENSRRSRVCNVTLMVNFRTCMPSLPQKRSTGIPHKFVRHAGLSSGASAREEGTDSGSYKSCSGMTVNLTSNAVFDQIVRRMLVQSLCRAREGRQALILMKIGLITTSYFAAMPLPPTSSLISYIAMEKPKMRHGVDIASEMHPRSLHRTGIFTAPFQQYPTQPILAQTPPAKKVRKLLD